MIKAPAPAESMPAPVTHSFMTNRMAGGRGPKMNTRLAMAQSLMKQMAVAHALRGQ